MIHNPFVDRLLPARVALEMPDHYVWDCSVVAAADKYHLFCSRWPKERGFGWNWVFRSEVVRCEADAPAGPYRFAEVVLPARGRQYFDGRNTHNPCVREYGGKYYLYYMGTTYGAELPAEVPVELSWETWNRKRIGLAVAERWGAPFVRGDAPLLEPRDCSHWDCTITTNPSPAILPDGTTYLIYKSRRSFLDPMQLGMAVAPRPDGPFERLGEGPILQFENPDWQVEDPFLWYDAAREVFCLIAKDCPMHGGAGMTDGWGNGFYAESRDGIRFELAVPATAYRRRLRYADGSTRTQCNLERPSLLFDNQGKPTHLFCATGHGKQPYHFEGGTYIVCIPLAE